MKHQHKTIKGEVKELNEKGEGLIVFATLNVIDSDEDVTLKGAFGNQTAPIVPAHDWGQAPIGKAKIREEGDSAIADIKLNLKTDGGRNWYESLKFDMENPPSVQEYSYGYHVLAEEKGDHEGRPVRFLKSLKVHEISPVLLGAGVGTGTLDLKSEKKETQSTLEEDIQFVKEGTEKLIKRVSALKDLREKDGRDISKDRIQELLDIEGFFLQLKQLCEAPKDEELAKAVKGFDDLTTKLFDMKKDLLYNQ